ncbi:MAG: hypothetical protein C0621_10390 [Desulfuromonas sp.]|nr:MAG: hypothetical protein C0621_10390 [Desulfuromonas sp.]
MTKTDLLALLRNKCDELGQATVARAIGYSPSAVNQALSGTYKGSLDNLLDKVEEVYGSSTVECPVLGIITLAQCGRHRRRPFAPTNPQRVVLWRACQKCPHNGSGK